MRLWRSSDRYLSVFEKLHFPLSMLQEKIALSEFTPLKSKGKKMCIEQKTVVVWVEREKKLRSIFKFSCVGVDKLAIGSKRMTFKFTFLSKHKK